MINTYSKRVLSTYFNSLLNMMFQRCTLDTKEYIEWRDTNYKPVGYTSVYDDNNTAINDTDVERKTQADPYKDTDGEDYY